MKLFFYKSCEAICGWLRLKTGLVTVPSLSEHSQKQKGVRDKERITVPCFVSTPIDPL